MSHSLRKQVQLTRMNRGLLQGVFEIIFVSIAPNCNSAKTVAKAIYSRKKRTRQLNLNVSDHFNNRFLSNSQLTYVKALKAIAKSAYDFHIHKYL